MTGNTDPDSLPSCGTALNDPWQSDHPSPTPQTPSDPAAGFEDNFASPEDNVVAAVEQLPDSQEYLAALEAKLKRVQKKGSMVKDLEKRREDEMRRFLAGGDPLATADLGLDAEGAGGDLGDSALLRFIAPERVALTEEEKTALVKADILDKSVQEANEAENESSEGEKCQKVEEPVPSGDSSESRK